VRPRELQDLGLPPANARAHLRVVVNGRTIATFEGPGPRRPPGRAAARAERRVEAAIPAPALGSGASMSVALVNDGGSGVALKRVRLVEALPSFSLSHLQLGGRFPAVSAILLAAGLALLLGARLRRLDEGTRSWRRALGPALGLLLLSLAVAAPRATRGIPRWAWLFLIVGLLPLGRGHARPVTAPRGPASVLAGAVRRGLLALTALAVSLGAAEFGLRAVFHDEPWARGMPQLLHPVLPDAMNSLGFDEREFPLRKPPGVYRIAVLGDSLSVSAPRAARLERVIVERLNAQFAEAVTYEAVNFGRVGADTQDETKILREAVWRTDPDFVLLEWYVNDLENGDYVDRPRGADLIPFAAIRRAADRSLFRWMLQEQFNVLQERLGFLETYPAYMYRTFGDPANPRWEGAAEALRDFIGECRAHRTPVAIALLPHLSPGLPAGAYEFAELHDQVLELCRREAVPCVDLRSTFGAYRDYARLWVSRFDQHPNALAHRRAGEHLVEVLGPLWRAAGGARGRVPSGNVRPSAEAPHGVSQRPDPVDRDADDVIGSQSAIIGHEDTGPG
jgi:GDSL-like Lipase/Acylhydrolase family